MFPRHLDKSSGEEDLAKVELGRDHVPQGTRVEELDLDLLSYLLARLILLAAPLDQLVEEECEDDGYQGQSKDAKVLEQLSVLYAHPLKTLISQHLFSFLKVGGTIVLDIGNYLLECDCIVQVIDKHINNGWPRDEVLDVDHHLHHIKKVPELLE